MLDCLLLKIVSELRVREFKVAGRLQAQKNFYKFPRIIFKLT